MIGKWQGFFVDKRALQGHESGSKWLIDVIITFYDSNTFTGTGRDEVGLFSFTNGYVSGTRMFEIYRDIYIYIYIYIYI